MKQEVKSTNEDPPTLEFASGRRVPLMDSPYQNISQLWATETIIHGDPLKSQEGGSKEEE